MTLDENFIDFKCPYCDTSVSFPSDSKSKIQDCPNCSENLILPQEGGGVGQKIPIPIRTPRLLLRRFVAADWKDLLDVLSAEELFQYVEGGPLSDVELVRWLEQDSSAKLTTPDWMFCLGLHHQTEGKLIGYVGLNFTDASRQQLSLQIFVGRSFQRQGYATEAVNGVLGFGFEGISLHRVTASYDSRNVAAGRLLEKVGMRREGESLKDRFVNGEWVNTAWMAILDEEYLNSIKQPPVPK